MKLTDSEVDTLIVPYLLSREKIKQVFRRMTRSERMKLLNELHGFLSKEKTHKV